MYKKTAVRVRRLLDPRLAIFSKQERKLREYDYSKSIFRMRSIRILSSVTCYELYTDSKTFDNFVK